MGTRSKTAPVLPAALGGVAVEYDDSSNSAFGTVRAVCEAQVVLSPAGLAAMLSAASSYLTSGKVTSLQSAGAAVTVTGTRTQVAFTCLAADAATQIAALQALAITSNLTQVGGFRL